MCVRVCVCIMTLVFVCMCVCVYGPIPMSGLTDSQTLLRVLAKLLRVSQCREGLSPHLPSPFRESASVQSSSKGITHSLKRCDVTAETKGKFGN